MRSRTALTCRFGTAALTLLCLSSLAAAGPLLSETGAAGSTRVPAGTRSSGIRWHSTRPGPTAGSGALPGGHTSNPGRHPENDAAPDPITTEPNFGSPRIPPLVGNGVGTLGGTVGRPGASSRPGPTPPSVGSVSYSTDVPASVSAPGSVQGQTVSQPYVPSNPTSSLGAPSAAGGPATGSRATVSGVNVTPAAQELVPPTIVGAAVGSTGAASASGPAPAISAANAPSAAASSIPTPAFGNTTAPLASFPSNAGTGVATVPGSSPAVSAANAPNPVASNPPTPAFGNTTAPPAGIPGNTGTPGPALSAPSNPAGVAGSTQASLPGVAINSGGVTGTGPSAAVASNSILPPTPTLGGMMNAGATSGLVPAVSTGLPGSDGTNPLTPIYNAVVLSQLLSNPASTSSTTARNTTSPTTNGASTASAAMSGNQSLTPGATSGAGLPNVQAGVLDATGGGHTLPTVGNVAPPPLDIQNLHALPPVQASNQVSPEPVPVNPGGASIGLGSAPPIPEPSPLVLLLFASGAYLGRNTFRMRYCLR